MGIKQDARRKSMKASIKSTITKQNLHDCISTCHTCNTSQAPLPIFHQSKAVYFQDILTDRHLIPTYCERMDDNILYFSYGEPYYRSGKRTEDPDFLPVVFMFQGNLAGDSAKIFPYDTGGVFLGYYEDWSKLLSEWERYAIVNKSKSCTCTNKNKCLERLIQFVVRLTPVMRPQI